MEIIDFNHGSEHETLRHRTKHSAKTQSCALVTVQLFSPLIFTRKVKQLFIVNL